MENRFNNHSRQPQPPRQPSRRPYAFAEIRGSADFPSINGKAEFFEADRRGSIVTVRVFGLPEKQGAYDSPIFGFHIHSGAKCSGNKTDRFADTDGHFNPKNAPHPYHAGDMPPLFSKNGYAFMSFYNPRVTPEEAVGHTMVIHDMPDDFHTQPAGGSGMKIACGEIQRHGGMPSRRE